MRVGFWLGCGFAIALLPPPAWGDESQGVDFFEKQVRPILVARCHQCHGDQKQESDLRLDSLSGAISGGVAGPAVVPGNLDESLLVAAISYESDDLQMPPKGKLPQEEIDTLRRWVEIGAPWPNDDVAAQPKPFDLQQRKAEHWSWRLVQPQQPPAVKQTDWPRHVVDQFILARLEQEGLAPAADADRRTLIRRVTLDLIGLPPTPDEVAAFLADDTPQAYETLVDGLLASPRFGERWARHWFDLMRYAETYGHEFDYPVAHPWQYRDYVIRALNADVPYNQFVTEHLAGDLLPQPRLHPTEGYNESIIATGVWFMHEQTHAPTDVRQHEAERVDNQIDVMTKSFLGLTVGCARCHDHKFDAISTNDYYALTGFFKSARMQEAWLDPGDKIASIAQQLSKTHQAGTVALAEVLPQPNEATRDQFARWLLLAREVDQGRSLDAVAAENQLNAEQLARWVAALKSPEAVTTPHPLYVWTVLRNAPQIAASSRRILVKQLSESRDARTNNAAHQWLVPRGGNAFDDWFFTGWAFGDGPTRGKHWDASHSAIAAVETGIVHSGLVAGKLRGAVRSPTFTLSGKHIHVRAAGRKARFRVVIDNYMMEQHSGLLFSGLTVGIDTEDQFKWITVGGDLGNYRGERAYVMIEDDGDGYAAVEEIVQSDGPPPEDPASTLIVPTLERGNVDSLPALATAYGELWNATLTQWHAGNLDADHAPLLNWALASGLIDTTTTTAKLVEVRQQLVAQAQSLPEPMRVLAFTDGTGRDEPVSLRGKHQSLGEIVPRRFLEAIDGPQPLLATKVDGSLRDPNESGHSLRPGSDQGVPGLLSSDSGSGRMELARRIVDPANPFITRTVVNRLWHLLFGRGIVATVDNLGVQGELPTHPELLDWLADRFVKDGWSQKQMIRQLVLSRTYRMSSRSVDETTDQRDPANRSWHRANVRRLEGEAIRDSLLAVSGSLNETMYGPSVPIHLTPFMEGRGRPAESGPLDGGGRRSVYIAVRRNFLSPMMLAFDTPIPFTAVPRRSVSNVPAQALIMMNDPLVAELSRRWAERLLAETANNSAADRVATMYQQALCRAATDDELTAATAFIDQQADLLNLPADQRANHPQVWTDLAHVLFNHKEFILRN